MSCLLVVLCFSLLFTFSLSDSSLSIVSLSLSLSSSVSSDSSVTLVVSVSLDSSVSSSVISCSVLSSSDDVCSSLAGSFSAGLFELSFSSLISPFLLVISFSFDIILLFSSNLL